MSSLREPILNYLGELLGSMSGIVFIARNRGQLTNDQRPGILLLDGKEEVITTIGELKRVRMPPAIISLKPEIILIAKERDTADNLTVGGLPAPIGPELSHWLDLTQMTITSDQGLVDLVTPNGQILYHGHETDFQYGSSLLGALRMNFSFNYPWWPPSG